MKNNRDIFLDLLPSLDLHGYDSESAIVATNDFINDNIELGNEKIVIIHGIGSGILKKSVHKFLVKNKFVLFYKTDNFNSGCTIINLKFDKKR